VRGPAGEFARGCPGCAARMRVAASRRSDPRVAGLASVRLQRFLQPSVIKGTRYNEQYGTVEFEPTALRNDSRRNQKWRKSVDDNEALPLWVRRLRLTDS
jgi:hypothetical protein